MTNGCFDIFHLGHLQLINFSKSLGDELFIAINSDFSIKKLKGPSRPILDQKYRLKFISSIPGVTKAEIFKDTNCSNIIRKWRPDIYVKSSDYELNSLNKNEKTALEEVGSIIKFMEITEEVSSSSIISKIQSIKK